MATDTPILDKMIQRKTQWMHAAEQARAADFKPVAAQPKQFRLSPTAYDLYQAWARDQEDDMIERSRPLTTKEKGSAKALGEPKLKKGETRLHEIFAGLPVLKDPDLPGESVVVD